MSDDAGTDDGSGGDERAPGARPEEHLTDAARLEVRAEGANEPLQGGDPQLRPGQVGDEDAAPTIVGGEQDDDRAREERQALIDHVEDERAEG